ncbi:MAG: mechanosensitive ion channel family protein [Rubrobacteraceae bacterium]
MFGGVFGADNLTDLSAFSLGLKVLFTILILVGAFVVRWAVGRALKRKFGTSGESGGGGLSEAGRDDRYSVFWLRRVTGYVIWSIAILLVILVWAEFGRRAGFVVGLFSAGVAFALQNVLGSFAAWIGILTGKVFRAGDRVMMGGVRGDVIDVSPLRTTIMEMGSSGSGENSEAWVNARQYTGRIVTVSNKVFFEEPVYNYSKDFDYIWEEITVPLSYTTNWERGKTILAEEVEDATRDFREKSAGALSEMARHYLVPKSDVHPQVFLKLTDNWIELTARFVIPVRSARRVKSDISENLLRRYSEESIALASETSEIVGLPPLKIEGLQELLENYVRQNGNTSDERRRQNPD